MDTLHSTAFNSDELRDELTAYWRESPDNAARLRARVLQRLKVLKQASRDHAQKVLSVEGGLACGAALSNFQDDLIKLVYDFSAQYLCRSQGSPATEKMALIATGGYGRGLMAPGSDVDLLFLFPSRQTAGGESIVESVLYFLWDLGYKVGHATRNIDQTLKAAKDDMTIRTALLDARFIHGEGMLFRELKSRYITNVAQGTQREFIEAKLAERVVRLKRSGISRYRVEPNIKDGKGGLRDLNMLHWFAAYLNPAASGDTKRDVFSQGELATYERCEAYLWTVRCHLHFLTNKAEERLSFDVQPEMAQRLCYRYTRELLPVERFMKHYFLIAKDVGDLTRIFCSSLELRQLKSVPTLSDFIGALPWSNRAKLAATTDFRVDTNRLNVRNGDVFIKDPINLIKMFVEAESHNLLLHPEAIRLARASLHLIGDDLRRDTEANRLFLTLLESRVAPEATLRAMNEAGVLGRFIPDFRRVVAMMQFNMYHHYTIDEHLIRAVGILSQIEKGALESELPLSTEIITNIPNRRALYVALLMHDVAKAVEGDHSLVGAEMTHRLALRLGLNNGEADTAGWLVKNHLVMSQYAQSRDISDPKTIRDFADIVQSPERLKLLLLLTVADIRAVGPGIWNGWKGQLLRSLYYDTEPLVAGGHTRLPRHARIETAQQNLRHALPDWPAPELERFIARLGPDYWMKTDTERQIQQARLIQRVEADALPMAFDIKTDAFLSLTELTLVTHDNPRLLMLFAGACAAANANIASAQISTTKDGLALDTLGLQRAFPDEAEEVERATRIARQISDVVSGVRSLESLAKTSNRLRPKVEAFDVANTVTHDNTASDRYTVIEVSALDRPGLLFDLARGLSDLDLNIASAHIATFGEKAVDVFYVTDKFRSKITDQVAVERLSSRLLELMSG